MYLLRIIAINICLLLICGKETYAQDTDSIQNLFLEQISIYPQEKIYVQTDKSAYVSGEMIWLRVHLLDALLLKQANASRYVYLELINPLADIVTRVMLHADSMGYFYGNVKLDETLPEGNYTLRAYTKDKKYPVLYIMHGGGEDQRGWAIQGKTDLIIDNLISEKKAVPMIVIMADGNFPLNGFGEEALKVFEKELKQSIIPFVEKNYRVKTEAKYRALAGLSMGGIQTLYAGVRNTDMFSYLGVFSSGWFADRKEMSEPQYEFIKNNTDKINSNLKLFWISQGGKEDIAWKNCQTMISKFDEMKIKYAYSEYPGGHSWPVWRNNLFNFVQLLFK